MEAWVSFASLHFFSALNSDLLKWLRDVLAFCSLLLGSSPPAGAEEGLTTVAVRRQGRVIEGLDSAWLLRHLPSNPGRAIDRPLKWSASPISTVLGKAQVIEEV